MPDEIDYDKLAAAINKTIAPGIATSLGDALGKAFEPIARDQKILADTLSKLPPAPATPPAKHETHTGDGGTKPLTAADVAQLLDERDKKREGVAALEGKKRDFLAANTKDSKAPARYFQLGDDPNQWATAIKTGQETWEKEFAAAGGKVTNVAAPPVTGKPPETQLDPTKLTQEQFAATFLPKVPGQPPAPTPEEQRQQQENKTAAA